ncbi:hypothetical protein E4U26_002774 [Claviceps purpurea]|nr:hypothetical protein E4U26_002774 [Claviceps purpurea]
MSAVSIGKYLGGIPSVPSYRRLSGGFSHINGTNSDQQIDTGGQMQCRDKSSLASTEFTLYRPCSGAPRLDLAFPSGVIPDLSEYSVDEWLVRESGREEQTSGFFASIVDIVLQATAGKHHQLLSSGSMIRRRDGVEAISRGWLESGRWFFPRMHQERDDHVSRPDYDFVQTQGHCASPF